MQTVSVSHCCRQKWIAVANLDHTETHNELKSFRKLAKQNKYEIKAVLWNPHVAKKQLIVSTVMSSWVFFCEISSTVSIKCAVSAEIGDMGCGCGEVLFPSVHQSPHQTCLVSPPP